MKNNNRYLRNSLLWMVIILFTIHCSLFTASCGLRKQTTTESETQTAMGPAFNADSAYLFCQQQCTSVSNGSSTSSRVTV